MQVRLRGWKLADPLPDTLSGDIIGLTSSLQTINGRPAVSYLGPLTAQTLKYVRALDANGETWGAPLTVDPQGGQYTSMAVVEGRPAIGYFVLATKELRYVRANDANGDAWGAPVVVASFPDQARYATLLVVEGNPAIAFYQKDAADGFLKYIRASNADGSAWPALPIDVDSGGDVGDSASMAIIAGNPAITYLDTTNQNLLYIRATHPTGSTWGLPGTVDMVGTITDTALAEVNGLPGIAYFNDLEQNLMFARAFTLAGADFEWIPLGLDSSGENTGRVVSMDVFNGYAAIAYYGYTGALKYIRASNPDASSWYTPEPIGGYAVLNDVFLTEINGAPTVTFGHLDLNTLEYGLGYYQLY